MAPLGPSIHWVGSVIVFVFVFVCDGNNSAHIIKCSLVWTKGISEWAKWSFLVTAINPLTAWLLSLLMVCLFVNENSFSATQRWTTTAAAALVCNTCYSCNCRRAPMISRQFFFDYQQMGEYRNSSICDFYWIFRWVTQIWQIFWCKIQ